MWHFYISLQQKVTYQIQNFSLNTTLSVCNLGLKHFQNPAFCELHCICHYIDYKSGSNFDTSIAYSRIDYCNSLYYRLPRSYINWILAVPLLQLLIIFYVISVLHSLHWLKINEYIKWLEAEDVLPKINHMQATERAEKCCFCPWWPWPLTFDLDIQTRPSEGPNTKHVLRVNLSQIHSAVPEIFDVQTKIMKSHRRAKTEPYLRVVKSHRQCQNRTFCSSLRVVTRGWGCFTKHKQHAGRRKGQKCHFLFLVTLTFDLWPWHSNSSHRWTKHMFCVNLVQIRSVVPDNAKYRSLCSSLRYMQ